jgi:hypothetical protein
VEIPPLAPAPAEQPELAVEAVVFEPPGALASDDPPSIEFEVSFPSEEVVRNRW